MAHQVGKFKESDLQSFSAYRDHSQGYTQATLIDHTAGSVHTCTRMCQLAPQGLLSPHFHAFEESFYILQGEAVLSLEGQAYHLRQGDLGAIKVGQVHAWRNVGSEPIRWFQMAAPQPKPAGGWQDTYFLKDGTAAAEGKPLDVSDTDGNLLSHFDAGQIPPPDDPARKTAGAPPGVFLKWIIDENLGAIHHRLLFIEYQPGVNLAMHDHTFEECYFILSGEIEAVIENERYLAKPGDVLWTSVGCFHSFANIGTEPVRWLETFAPQPPRENVFRFRAEWEKKAQELGCYSV
jgi:mannose-6-phosphate isomerase-like protein (cupin superfamily)